MARLLDEVSSSIPHQDSFYRAKARARLEQLTMPYWALGRLMDLAEDLAGMTQSMSPPVSSKTVVIMAADHGVVAEGVSKYPQEVTSQMVRNFVNRGAGINAIAGVVGASVAVVDMGVAGDLSDLVAEKRILSKRVGAGTQNIARGAAMTKEQAIRSLEAGIEIALQLGPVTDVFATGDMGIGNTTASTAILCAMTSVPPDSVTGPGTGLEEDQLRHKAHVIQQALNVTRPQPGDGLDVLAKVGGFEIGGIAGLILGSALQRKPVVVDGLISTAGALVAHALASSVDDFMIPGHQSQEIGHRAMWAHLKKTPLLDLGLRLGEGTGAALAMGLLDAAVAVLTRVSTFEDASVSKAGR